MKKDKDYLVDQCLGLKKRIEILEQRLKACQHETIVKWQEVNEEMPDAKHIEKRTQFLLKGAYGTPGRLGATCYIVSRLDEAAYTCGDEIVFETPVGFIPEKWQHIK